MVLRLPQRAGAIRRTILLIVVLVIVLPAAYVVHNTMVAGRFALLDNYRMKVWRPGLAETLGLPIDYVKPTHVYRTFRIFDERGYCERLVSVDNHNEIRYARYPATFPLDFTTAAYSPSAMADIVKKELAWFLAEEPENLSCTVQDKELNAAEEEPEMLYIHCHNTATDRRYIAEIYYANEPKDIGRGLKSIVRVEEANAPAPSTP